MTTRLREVQLFGQMGTKRSRVRREDSRAFSPPLDLSIREECYREPNLTKLSPRLSFRFDVFHNKHLSFSLSPIPHINNFIQTYIRCVINVCTTQTVTNSFPYKTLLGQSRRWAHARAPGYLLVLNFFKYF